MRVRLVPLLLVVGCAVESPRPEQLPFERGDLRAIIEPEYLAAQPEPEQSGPFEETKSPRPELGIYKDLITGEVREVTLSEVPALSEPSRGSVDAPIRPGISRDELRTNVTNTTAYPARTTVKLYSTYSNGQRFVCSGTLIGVRFVLTAGHCVFNSGRGGWATEVRAVPGQSGSYMPYGDAYSTGLISVTAYTEDGTKSSDFAMVYLDRDLGSTVGWLGMSSTSPEDDALTMNGYPAETYDGLTQVLVTGSEESTTSDMVYYTLESEGGFSGSSVRRTVATNYVSAINTRSNCYGFPITWSRACGVRLNSSRVQRIVGWMQ